MINDQLKERKSLINALPKSFARYLSITCPWVLFIGLNLTMAGCTSETTSQEQPEFTQNRPSFTGDRSSNAVSRISFTEITKEAGISFTHETGAFGNKWMPETMGSGGGFIDYDNDGRPDIFLVNSTTWPGQPANPSATSRLFRNTGNGTFEDVTQQTGTGLSIYGMGAAFSDFDADGDTDIYVTALGDNKLLRNNNGQFTDITRQMGVEGNSNATNAPPAWSTSAAWVDVDRDGWLDLFVANYVKWTPETDIYVTRDGKTKSYATPEGYQGETSRLYRNIEGKRFEDVTAKAGVLNEEGKSLGIAVADFNDDGWPDLVVSNDTQPNFLYINQGDGTFNDVAIPSGIGYDEIGRARAGMGIDIADVENEGRLSIAIGNFSKEPLSLYTQIGDGQLFQDQAGTARLTRSTLLALTFGLQFADFDLDGYLDLVTANGHIEPEINNVQQDITFAQQPQIFHNNGGRFVEVSDQAGPAFAQSFVGRGIATADIDSDGDLDILFTTNGSNPHLLRNDTEQGAASHRVHIHLLGETPNRNAIGAKVTLWSKGKPQSRMVRTGSSYLTQSDISGLTFGLGSTLMADSLVVRWPTSGRTVIIQDIKAGETYQIREADSASS